ncbi:MAG TPA: META domain-containing protein, partial [candidate division Zixibacteria bacterium]|nr:META domain-containing protein [candidate division Zixibacteria bacterium]
KVVTIVELGGGGKPTAIMAGPIVAGAGEDVTFSAANSFPGGDPIVAYQWTSGDGHESGRTQDSMFTTSYEEPGVYIAEVTVIDANDLTDRASIEIVIEFTLAGTSWQMDNSVRGTSVTLNFDELSLSGHSGCNGYSANYSTSAWDGVSADITVGPVNGASLKCSQEVMHQEQAYLSILQSASRISVDGSTLTMETRSGALTFSQVAP